MKRKDKHTSDTSDLLYRLEKARQVAEGAISVAYALLSVLEEHEGNVFPESRRLIGILEARLGDAMKGAEDDRHLIEHDGVPEFGRLEPGEGGETR